MINQQQKSTKIEIKCHVASIECTRYLHRAFAPVIIPKFCIEAYGSRSLGDFFGDILCEIFGEGLMFLMVVTSLHGDFLLGGGCNILDTFLK